jgi:hypothetical protein
MHTESMTGSIPSPNQPAQPWTDRGGDTMHYQLLGWLL